MTDKIVVFTTCGSAEEAEKIARTLVERRLAACVNALAQVQSTYRWKGAVEQAPEWLLIIKTRRHLFQALERALDELHSYEVPELIAVPVVDGAAGYLGWLDEQVG